MTTEALKAFFQTPLALFFLMLVASFGSAFKELYTTNKETDSAFTLGMYLSHWPETIMSLGGNIIAFITLVMTDQLNFAAALGIGYGINSVSGAIGTMAQSSGGRTAQLMQNENPPKPKE